MYLQQFVDSHIFFGKYFEDQLLMGIYHLDPCKQLKYLVCHKINEYAVLLSLPALPDS